MNEIVNNSDSMADDGHHATVKSGEDRFRISGYQTTKARTILLWLLTFIVPIRLIINWISRLDVRLRGTPCSLEVADLILIKYRSKKATIRKVVQKKADIGEHFVLPSPQGDGMYEVDELRWFTFRKVKYFWNRGKFVSLADSCIKLSVLQKVDKNQGLDTAEVTRRLLAYGHNVIDVVPKSYIEIFIRTLCSKSYFFQLFSITVWILIAYYYYTCAVIIFLIRDLKNDVIQRRKRQVNIQKLARSDGEVRVIREGECKTISSNDLVVGDLLVIPRLGGILHCDAVMLNGSSIVNESSLTGESVPITKTALRGTDEESDHEDERLDEKNHNMHIVYGGTKVLRATAPKGQLVKAIVIRTGFGTEKGKTIRSIIYQKHVNSRFTMDLSKFLCILCIFGAYGFSHKLIWGYTRGYFLLELIVRSLDIITIVVPSALPSMITNCLNQALKLLKSKKIHCNSPSTIIISGSVDVCAFDKTGTLTEEGVQFKLMRAIHSPKTKNGPQFTSELEKMDPAGLPHVSELVKACATCHSLTSIDGALIGDPIDLVLFNQTGWSIKEENEEASEQSEMESDLDESVHPTIICPPPNSTIFPCEEYAIIRQFPFSSELQRSSVIVGNANGNGSNRLQSFFCKGAPEMISSLCRPESIPVGFAEIVNQYAQRGHRLIAVAKKSLDATYARASKIPRGELEKEMELMGLMVLENRLKPQTIETIEGLNRANIRTQMITGDNVLTGISVARESGIILPNKKVFLIQHDRDQRDNEGRTILLATESVSSSTEINDRSLESEIETTLMIDSDYQLAISGSTFSVIKNEYPGLVHKVVDKCAVFARMAPEQKKDVVEMLKENGNTVAFCGDGANDCAALSAANVGISLSENEASMAAPFVSEILDISCVSEVIREGRANLVSLIGIANFMISYALSQFFSSMLLFTIDKNLTDLQFLYIDLGIVLPIAFVYGLTPACESLSSIQPPNRIFTIKNLISILGQLMINCVTQISTFVLITHQSWFSPPTRDEYKSMQGTAVFCTSIHQNLAFAVIYSVGAPYRQKFFRNTPLICFLVCVFIVNIGVTIFPPSFVTNLLEFEDIPTEYRVTIFMIAALSVILMFFYEKLIACLCKKFQTFIKKKKDQKRGLMEDSANQEFEQILGIAGSLHNRNRQIVRYVPAASEMETALESRLRMFDEINGNEDDYPNGYNPQMTL